MKKTLSLNEGWIFCKNGEKETVNLPHTWNGLDGQGEGEGGYFRGACTYTRILPKYSGKVILSFLVQTVWLLLKSTVELQVHTRVVTVPSE
jgi:hypothetical protein